MSDIYYNNVSLLLHCDGTDNSTTFTDNSSSPKTVTANGNAKLKTVAGGGQVKYGTAAGYFDGTGDYLSIPNSTAFDLGSGAFTLECWVRPTSISGVNHLVGKWVTTNSSAYQLYLYTNGAVGLQYSTTGSYQAANYLQSADGAVSTGSWQHIACVRSGNTIKIYVGGTEVASKDVTGITIYNTTNDFTVGGSSGGNNYTGYIDDLRITKGVARYTATFTPPSAALPDYGGPVTVNGIASATALGSVSLHRYVALTGYAGTALFGTPFLTEPVIYPNGIASTTEFGTFNLFESLAYRQFNGFAESPAFGALRLQEFLLPSSFADAALFGNPAFVPQIRLTGFNGAALFGTPDFAPPPIAKNWLRTRYLCHLTGAADGESDLLLPMSSFAIRLNSSTASSFVQVVIPGVDSYADAIAARPNGSILITRIYDYLDGSSLTYEMARADFDSLRTDTGGQSGSTGTMQGYYTLTSSTARTYDLSDPTYRSWDGETVRYRCELNPLIRPGDTVTINEETIELRSIQHNVDVTLCLSEISGVIV